MSLFCSHSRTFLFLSPVLNPLFSGSNTFLSMDLLSCFGRVHFPVASSDRVGDEFFIVDKFCIAEYLDFTLTFDWYFDWVHNSRLEILSFSLRILKTYLHCPLASTCCCEVPGHSRSGKFCFFCWSSSKFFF